MDYSSYQRIFPNLSVREIERLHQFRTNFPNQTIDWLKIIDKSDDLDPHRARAIDLARIRSAIKYMANNGEKANAILKYFYNGVEIKPFNKYFL